VAIIESDKEPSKALARAASEYRDRVLSSDGL